jgi:cytosine/adenosine deaminase-related metal-dependent hydrolase
MNKHYRRASLVAALWAGAGTPAIRAQEPQVLPFAITGVNVIDVEAGALLANRTVMVEGGRIRSVTNGAQAPAGVRVIDGTGKYLIPGLWDMHAHLRHPLAPDLIMPQFVANGVTGVREMSSDCDGPAEDQICLPQMQEWRGQIERGERIGPRLVALSSFIVNPPWTYNVTAQQVQQLVARFDSQSVDLIKVYYRLSPDALRMFIDEAKKHDIAVSGHLPLRMTSIEASNAGLRSLEHARDFLFDCFPGSQEFRSTAMSQNPPMSVMRSMVEDHAPALCDDVFRAFVSNETWYVPTHVTRRMDAFADDSAFRNDARSKYIPADVWKEWQADADRMVALDPSPEGRRVMRSFYEKGLELTRRAHAAGVKIMLGTDAGDTYVFFGSGLHDELGEFVKAGLAPADALRAATIRPAEFLGLDAEYGSVQDGRHADLVLLDANPLESIANTRAIHAVILGGRVFDRTELDRMLQEVESGVAARATGEMQEPDPPPTP